MFKEKKYREQKQTSKITPLFPTHYHKIPLWQELMALIILRASKKENQFIKHINVPSNYSPWEFHTAKEQTHLLNFTQLSLCLIKINSW